VALSLNPDHPGALMNMMQFYLHAPGIIGGDKTKARGIADHIAKLDPFQGVQAQIEIAAAAKDENRIDELQRKLAEMRAESFDGHLMVGNYMAGGKAKRYDEAERHAREAIRLKPDRVAGHALLAAALVRLDKWTELDAALAQAEKDDPDNLWPYYRAGNNLLDRKIDLPRAERYFRKYLTQEPEMRMPSLGAAHWRLSLVLEQEGRKPESASEWQTAQKLDPALKKK
jgi:tetratricopeptide (TPR) repeat protein